MIEVQLYNLILLGLNIFLKKIMHVFYCVAFVEDMVAGKTLLDYTILFSPNDYKKNGKKIYKYFIDKYGKRSKSCV